MCVALSVCSAYNKMWINHLLVLLNILFVNGNINDWANQRETFLFPGENGKVYNIFSKPSILQRTQYESPKFLLYTDDTNIPYNLVTGDSAILKNSGFDPRKTVKIITHGWMGDYSSEAVEMLRTAYLANTNANVIVIDWKKVAGNFYILSIMRMNKLAKECADFIDFLVINGGVTSSDLHMIGFSVGAHLVGKIGKNLSVGKVFAITGLDPATPFFPVSRPDQRLDRSDADYVEVIHTSFGNHLAFKTPIGHLDIYVNGGTFQPGCDPNLLSCSHERAFRLYADSILHEGKYEALQCRTIRDAIVGTCDEDEKHPMGGFKVKTGSGLYRLNTPNSISNP